MGPNKLKLVLAAAEREELRQALKTLTDPRSRDRVRAVQLATTGQHTHEEIALLVGRARSTIQQWIERYEAGGLNRLLKHKKAPGQKSPLQEPALQAKILEGLKKGIWRTAGQLTAWLEQSHHWRNQTSGIVMIKYSALLSNPMIWWGVPAQNSARRPAGMVTFWPPSR